MQNPCLGTVVLPEAKTVTELHRETQDHDLVVVPEAPLFLALNRRVHGARLGYHAVTPKIWAQDRLDWPDRRELFLQIVGETGMGWRRGAYLLERSLSCWEETGDLDAIETYPRFRTREVQQVLDVLRTEPSSYLLRHRRTISHDENVAVVDPHHLTALDRKVLPEDPTVVSRFHDATTELPPFHVLPNASAITRTIGKQLEHVDPMDVGIVLSATSPYRPQIESMLEARGIDYARDVELQEDPALRTFLRLLELGLSPRRVRAREVRPLLRELDVAGLHPRDDRKLLHTIDQEALADVRAFWEGIEGATFAEVLSAFRAWTDVGLPHVEAVLRDLLLLDEPVTQAHLDGVRFFLQEFEVSEDRTQEGVLLATPEGNTLVDRPVVFHLGMDLSWSLQVPQDPWTDRDAWRQRNRERFLLLLQNGSPPTYLVQDVRSGQPVTPSLHLIDLVDHEVEGFTDLGATRRAPPEPPALEPFQRTPLDLDVEPVRVVSASTLDKLARCPRMHLFDRVVTGPARDYMARGSAVHHAAEVLLHHPGILDERMDDVVAWLVDEVASFGEEEHRDLEETDLRLALRNIAAFLQEHAPTAGRHPAYGVQDRDNRLAKHLGLDLERTHTELWFEDEALGVKGKVDLLHSVDHLVDYKTSRSATNATKVREAALPDGDSDRPTFQPLVYLAHHAKHEPGTRHRFTLLHLLANRTDLLQGKDPSMDEIGTTLEMHPGPFREWVVTEEAFEAAKAGSKQRGKAYDGLGYAAYRRVMERCEHPDWTDKDAVVESELAQAMLSEAQRVFKDAKYVRTQVPYGLGQLADARKATFFPEDAEALVAFVQEQIEALNRYRATRFPLGDADPRDLDRPDLLLTHLTGDDA